MKTNEAPEKIYYHKGKLRTPFAVEQRLDETDVEYTRTDAFIEKACEWLKKNADYYTWYNEFEGESGMIDEFIDDFKNYMKGE